MSICIYVLFVVFSIGVSYADLARLLLYYVIKLQIAMSISKNIFKRSKNRKISREKWKQIKLVEDWIRQNMHTNDNFLPQWFLAYRSQKCYPNFHDEIIMEDTSVWSDVKAIGIKYVADKTGRSRIENDIKRHFEKMKHLKNSDYTIYQLSPLNFQRKSDDRKYYLKLRNIRSSEFHNYERPFFNVELVVKRDKNEMTKRRDYVWLYKMGCSYQTIQLWSNFSLWENEYENADTNGLLKIEFQNLRFEIFLFVNEIDESYVVNGIEFGIPDFKVNYNLDDLKVSVEEYPDKKINLTHQRIDNFVDSIRKTILDTKRRREICDRIRADVLPRITREILKMHSKWSIPSILHHVLYNGPSTGEDSSANIKTKIGIGSKRTNYETKITTFYDAIEKELNGLIACVA